MRGSVDETLCGRATGGGADYCGLKLINNGERGLTFADSRRNRGEQASGWRERGA